MRFDALLQHGEALPGVTLDRKWGADLCLLVGNKMFAVFGLDAQDKLSSLSFKVDPARFLELTDQPGIRPAPYLARHHWIALDSHCHLPYDQLADLMSQSYRLVRDRLPKRVQAGLPPPDDV